MVYIPHHHRPVCRCGICSDCILRNKGVLLDQWILDPEKRQQIKRGLESKLQGYKPSWWRRITRSAVPTRKDEDRYFQWWLLQLIIDVENED